MPQFSIFTTSTFSFPFMITIDLTPLTNVIYSHSCQSLKIFIIHLVLFPKVAVEKHSILHLSTSFKANFCCANFKFFFTKTTFITMIHFNNNV